MNVSRWIAFATALCAAAMLPGCKNEEVYQVEVCFRDEGQMREFYRFMQGLAERSDLIFVDGSADFNRYAAASAAAAAADGRERPPVRGGGGQTIYFGADAASDSGGFTAGNIGLNPLQVAVGMSPTETKSFDARAIRRVIMDIRERWSARQVPSSQAFLPREGCGDGRGTT